MSKSLHAEYQRSIGCLIGKRAVITLAGVQIVTPIDQGAKATTDLFYALIRERPDDPAVLVFDGWTRGEYGRPMTNAEIEEALMASGFESAYPSFSPRVRAAELRMLDDIERGAK